MDFSQLFGVECHLGKGRNGVYEKKVIFFLNMWADGIPTHSF